ncbi:MAG: disulfide bond formation protein B [Cocleimonas sp.]|nr:disulfide bond formation protein B [Cocleimonas sp.]
MKINTIKSIRPAMFIGLLISLGMLATALFFQYYMELIPCPLCIVQRVIVMVFAGIFLLALLQGPKTWGRRVYGLLLTLTSIAGLIVAGRHTWLQHLPKDTIPECGPGLEFWMNNLPANEVIQKVFQGSGECAEVVWSFLSLSIPEWSLIAFGLFLLYSLKLLFLAR